MSDPRDVPEPDALPAPEEEAAAAALAEALASPDPGAPGAELAPAISALRAAAPAEPTADGLARVLAAGALPARPRPWRWLLPLGGLAAASAAALVLLITPPRGAGLPPPGRDLLLAQAKATRGTPQPLAQAMRGYRREVYLALGARYGEGT